MKKPNKDVPMINTKNAVSRFDLEEQIVGCWGIIDELESTLNCSNQAQLLEAIIVLYNHKFERCFATFENLLKAQKV